MEECRETSIMGMRNVLLVSQNSKFYAPHMDCLIHIGVTEGFLINVTFHYFDLEPPDTQGHCRDSVELFNGHGTQLKLSGPLCGNKLVGPFISNQSHVTVLFRTEERAQRTGFRLIYDRVHPSHLEDMGILEEVLLGRHSQNNVESLAEVPRHGDRMMGTTEQGGHSEDNRVSPSSLLKHVHSEICLKGAPQNVLTYPW